MMDRKEQEQIARFPLNTSRFLEGIAGSGKTTIGTDRLHWLLESGVPANEILILVPQRTLGIPYGNVLSDPNLPPGGQANILTMGGLAQRMTHLFWPMIAASAGFSHPEKPPIFLTLETAQYYMARIVNPLLDQGYFENIHVDRNRLISQILDNLNKAAGVGFSHLQIGERLDVALTTDVSQKHVFQHVQECASRFREMCLQNQLLDFSLQLEILTNHLWHSFIFREYLHKTYRHLIYDNIEEDIPMAHDLVREWLSHFESALLIADLDGGFRQFLGADPVSAFSLRDECNEVIPITGSQLVPSGLLRVQRSLSAAIFREDTHPPANLRHWLVESHAPFYPELVNGVCVEVQRLVSEENVPPGSIVILSPFLSDSLHFTVSSSLDEFNIPNHTLRPSRSLRDEPAVQCIFTLAILAHPNWGLQVNRPDLATAFLMAVDGLDPVRADLAVRILMRGAASQDFSGFDQVNIDKQQRITFSLGNRIEELRSWIMEYRERAPDTLDVFISRLFGEILSREGFRFHRDFNAAAVTARLVESIQKFRRAVNIKDFPGPGDFETEYIRMIQSGILAAQSIPAWEDLDADSVLIAPAHTYLMSNRPVRIQFWLDIGSRGWSERLFQPLTHPVVLSRSWSNNQKWTDQHERDYSQQSLDRLISGLIRRCSQRIYACAVGVDEQGNEQRGDLILAISSLLRSMQDSEEISDV